MVYSSAQWHNVCGGGNESRHCNIEEKAIVIHVSILCLFATDRSQLIRITPGRRWWRACLGYQIGIRLLIQRFILCQPLRTHRRRCRMFYRSLLLIGRPLGNGKCFVCGDYDLRSHQRRLPGVGSDQMALDQGRRWLHTLLNGGSQRIQADPEPERAGSKRSW